MCFSVNVPNVELFPHVSHLVIERGDDFNITCQSHGLSNAGHSYLSWHRLYKNGSLVKITDPSTVWRGKDLSLGGHHLDNEVLMFRNFNKDKDAGNYTCRYDNDGNSASVSVTVDQKGKYFLFLVSSFILM